LDAVSKQKLEKAASYSHKKLSEFVLAQSRWPLWKISFTSTSKYPFPLPIGACFWTLWKTHRPKMPN
jgi:hypothetical protein